MHIHIAYDNKNKPVGVLLADSLEKAQIAWAGMGLQVHSTETIDPNNPANLGVHGVIFLLTSQEYNSRDFSHRSYEGVNFRHWKRGM